MTIRKINFRGKSAENHRGRATSPAGKGEWVYGAIFQDPRDGSCHIFHKTMMYWIRIDPATVGEYTGVDDEYGTPVYEGDIIRHGDDVFEVVFGDGCFWRKGRTDTMELHTILGMGEFEVVGNIYDNLEQLVK